MRRDVTKRFFHKNKREKEDVEELIKIAKRGGIKAARASRVLGLSVKFISNGEIIERTASGETKIIRRIRETMVVSNSKHNLKKGAVLCRK